MQIDAPRKPERTYLTVLSSIDQTGLMKPAEILWPDGRRFHIDKWKAGAKHRTTNRTPPATSSGSENRTEHCTSPKAPYAALSTWADGT